MRMEGEEKERVAGIDVSKAGLDVWVEAGRAERYENTKKGIRALVKRLGRERIALTAAQSVASNGPFGESVESSSAFVTLSARESKTYCEPIHTVANLLEN